MYDVIVVGAGPAGSTAAKTAAELGLNVLLIEKRQEIGTPVRCAEGTGKKSLMKFIELDPKWIAARLKGARIYSPNGTMVKIDGNEEIGLILERKIFDRELAKLAARAGAQVQVKTRATGVLMENGFVRGITASQLNKEFKIKSKVVIAADGVESQVARWAGVDTAVKLKDIESCAQFLIADIDIDEEYADFYVGNRIAPSGYLWVFPKGEREANVGVGILASKSSDLRAIDYLKNFAAKKFPNGKIIEMVLGGVPVSGPIKRAIANGLIIAGDAARQADPITGGGIVNAMYAGKIAGEVAARAVEEENYSSEVLREYEDRWRASLGKELARHYKVKEVLSSLTDEDFNSLAESLQGIDLKAQEFSVHVLLKELILRNPKILFKLRNLFLPS
ncbi:MAG: NAD(P)/FAD-dependent oxidoreductase [Methanocellales archaeon]